jgi:hypothetical protein
MGRERAKDFAERLPRLIPQEEADISHLSDEMADILYPRWRTRPYRMGISFEAFAGEDYARAVELARRSSTYREVPGPDGPTHHAAFEATAARVLRDLYDLVGQRPGTEVLVDGKRAPYAHELWLPLFWIFVGGEA